MTPERRRIAFLPVGAGLAGMLLWAIGGLPTFGSSISTYGRILDRVAVPERHATNVVTAIVFDYRGVDTMGEEFILFAAAIGIAMLLRVGRGEVDLEPTAREETRRSPLPSDAVRTLGMGLVGATVLLGLAVVSHGPLTPGGGFQGGVVLATAPVIVFLAGTYASFHHLTPQPLIDLAEGAGAGGYAVIGSLALLSGSAFLTNVLPLGRTGDLFSAGTIAVLNLSVGLAVSAGFVLILWEFLEQAFAIRKQGRGG